jgi:hypothetical protein
MRSLERTRRDATSSFMPSDPGRNLAFVGWASGIFLVGSLIMLLLCRHATGGRIIYVLDDPAIHLGIAQMLLHHGTWGVQPGVYQSASSSPLWDVVLAGTMWISRAAAIVPWLLNVFAGVWLIWAVGSRQQVLRPRRSSPLSVLATAALVVVVLFMPSLTMVGMEALVHCAMVVQLVAWMHDRAVGRISQVPTWALCALAALAVLTRFETVWVVAGVGLGYLIDGWTRHPHDRSALARRLQTVVWLGVATAAPVAAYAALNQAMGQGLLPNSVLVKTPGTESPQVFVDRLNSDRVVALLLILAIVYLAIARPPTRQAIVPAVTLLVAIPAHTVFAQYGDFDRYQAYLIALGVYFALSVAGEAIPDRTNAIAVTTLAILTITPVLWSLLVLTPASADNTYQQRYQAALFVQRYYQGRPIATSELGYISLLHQGPVTDLLGLGDYEVLKHRMNGTDNQAFYSDLARRRQFPIAIDYPFTLGSRTPANWILVGRWDLHERLVTAYKSLDFWATSPAAAIKLRADLIDNAHLLPRHVSQVLNSCLAARPTDTKIAQCTAPTR